MYVLELFSGMECISNAFRNRGGGMNASQLIGMNDFRVQCIVILAS